MKKKPLKISWRSWCLYKLAGRDYSAFELGELMKKRARESGETVDSGPVIQRLVEEGAICDERYVRSQISLRSDVYSRQGPLALRRHLREKGGVPELLIDQHIDNDDPKWDALAKKICQRTLLEKDFLEDPPCPIPEKLHVTIKQKLFRKGFTKRQIEVALSDYTPQRDIAPPPDEISVAGVIRKKMLSGKGPFEIRKHLEQQGAEKSAIEKHLRFPDETWIDIATREREKRFGEQPPKTKKERQKQIDFLRRRGFLWEHIKHVFEM